VANQALIKVLFANERDIHVGQKGIFCGANKGPTPHPHPPKKTGASSFNYKIYVISELVNGDFSHGYQTWNDVHIQNLNTCRSIYHINDID
jgi:hypothetical protein